MFARGDMIIVTETPEVAFVTVAEVFGPIKGKGWLMGTEEGNVILVSGTPGMPSCRIKFIIDQEVFLALQLEVKHG
jgi:hypothetical protein